MKKGEIRQRLERQDHIKRADSASKVSSDEENARQVHQSMPEPRSNPGSLADADDQKQQKPNE